MAHWTVARRFFTQLSATLVVALLGAASASAQPTFSKAFTQDTIGPGSVSQLRFDLSNAAPGVVTGLAFADVLPAAVTIATPAFASTDCPDAILSAPAGGGTITFSGGSLPGFFACSVVVDVTASTPGTHMNTSGDLTSSAGNSGPAAADLTVATNRPGFSKSFAPDPISLGSRSTLTFTIDNSANPSLASFLTFSDTLPTGLAVADPANASTTCTGGTLTATPGSGLIAYSTGTVSAMTTCLLSVDVTGVGVGTQENRSGELSSSIAGPAVSSGLASDSITVTATTLSAQKAFLGDPVNPGATVVLEFTVANRDRDLAATNIAFTDDLDATLSGLVATGLPMMNVCGAGSMLSGVGLLSLTGGNLPAEGSCTFSVALQVPAAAAAGAYPNVTSTLTADLGGSPFVGDPAAETLFVNDAPSLTKTFLTDPVGTGDTATVEFTVTNNSSTSAATNIGFLDNLSLFLSGVSVVSGTGAGVCGGGSNLTTVSISGDLHLSLTGGNLAASGSCTFPVDLLIPAGAAPGLYLNMTTAVSATVDGTTQLGAPGSDTLTVVGAPVFSKDFTDDPVAPGGTMTLEFTLDYSEEATADATAITFTDDLNAALAGLAAVGLPIANVCGAGSSIAGTTNLTFTGGTLAPGTFCTFPVTVQVPAGAVPGTYTNTTSDLTTTVSGVTATRGPATSDFLVSGLELTKEFTDDPALPGGTATLRFTITNSTPGTNATGMSFSDNLDTALSGLVAVAPLPLTPCGAGSSIVGTSNLSFTGGNLLAGTFCTFDVTVQIPAGALSGAYLNSTSNLVADLGGGPIVLPPASDLLVVDADRLSLAKSFTDDPVAPGSTVTLEFTVTNLDGANAVTGITFSDDLDATLSGLAATGLPMMNVCGAGSTLSGAGLLSLTGGNLAAGGSCTFPVTLQVPAGAAPGIYPNATSAVTGDIGGLGVTGAGALDDLRIVGITFSKAFDGPSAATRIALLTFTIENLDSVNGATDLSFSDDLDAVIPGLAAVGLPLADVCGAGSQIAGTSFLTFSGGSLGPSATCIFAVTVQVPATATPGSFPNGTSDLLAAGLPVAPPAIDNLVIEPPPAFSKAFAPTSIPLGAASTLTFTIDNTASTLAASNLDFTDNLPAGLAVASPANPSTTCTGGTLTAVPGGGVISYTGGTVGGGATCTVQANVTGNTEGVHVNTSGALTSSCGNSGTAMATLNVFNDGIVLTKSFLSAPVLPGGTVTLELTVSKSSSIFTATDIAFTDDLGAVIPGLAAVGLPASDVCGTGSQIAGTAVISLTGGTLPPGGSCTIAVSVVVPPDAPLGIFTNTTGAPTATIDGNSVTGTPATADLEVDYLLFTKVFGSPVAAGGTTSLGFTILNPDPVNAATGLTFTDDLDAVIPGLVALDVPQADVCGAGSFLDGASLLTLTGGSLGPGASCTFGVTVEVPGTTPTGTFTNLTSPLDATVGGAPVAGGAAAVAMADLEVQANAIVIPTLRVWGLLLLGLALAAVAARRLSRP